jgi:diacylglycerol kinase (ATP)
MVERVLRALHRDGDSKEAVPTSGPGTAAGIAAQAILRGSNLILVAGGDGTINETINGMAHSDVPLGILPGGTANVLATELGIARGLERAAGQFHEWVPERISLGHFRSSAASEPRYFLLMAGVGLDAHIVYNLSATLKAAAGKLAYWVGGFSQLGRRFPEFDVTVEGRTIRVSFALISRVRNYGGDLTIAPTISLLDPEFEVVLFEGTNSFRYLKYMLGVVTRRLEGMRGVTILRTREVSLCCPGDSRIHIQLDGEYAGRLPAGIEMVPDSLTLLVPPAFRARERVSANQPAWTTSPTR